MKTAIIDSAQILTLWLRPKETEWKQYHVLRDEIKEKFPDIKDSHEITIMRYLQQLVKEGKLEKKIELDHSTWYRLKNIAELNKVLIKSNIDLLNNSDILFFLSSFTFEILLQIKEKEVKHGKIDIKELIKNSETVALELYEARKEIQEVAH